MFGKTWCVGKGWKSLLGGCSSLVPLFLGGKDSTLPSSIASLRNPPTHQNNSFLLHERKEGKNGQVPIQRVEREEKYSNNILEDFFVLSLFIPNIYNILHLQARSTTWFTAENNMKKRQRELKQNSRLVYLTFHHFTKFTYIISLYRKQHNTLLNINLLLNQKLMTEILQFQKIL